MGVNDFNEIIKKQPPVKNNYKFIIYDFSNIVVISLFSNFSRLREDFGVESLTIGNYKAYFENGDDLILLDVKSQIEKLLTWIIERLWEMIKTRFSEFSSLKEIYMITDPQTDYDYTFQITKKSQINAIDLDLFETWIDINEIAPDENGVIHFNSKKEERIKRSKYMSVPTIKIRDTSTNEILVSTKDYKTFDEEKAEKDLNYLYRVISQSLYFVDKHHLLKLIPLVQNKFIDLIKKNSLNVRFLESAGEADPCIKAFYESELFTEPTLIISADTDYWFLFGEVEDVDVVSPNLPTSLAKNPFTFWSKLFKSNSPMFLRLCIARASALLGNDYTQHLRIIAIDKFEDIIIKLFNIEENNFQDIPSSRARNLMRITRTMSKQKIEIPKWKKGLSPVEIIRRTFKAIDSAIVAQLYDEKSEKIKAKEFFNGYYETLLIYANYDLYEEYVDLVELNRDISSFENDFSIFEHFSANFNTGEISFENS